MGPNLNDASCWVFFPLSETCLTPTKKQLRSTGVPKNGSAILYCGEYLGSVAKDNSHYTPPQPL